VTFAAALKAAKEEMMFIARKKGNLQREKKPNREFK
jgi:hypothetical protein